MLPTCTVDALFPTIVGDGASVVDGDVPVAEGPTEAVALLAAGLPGSAYARIYLISKYASL